MQAQSWFACLVCARPRSVVRPTLMTACPLPSRHRLPKVDTAGRWVFTRERHRRDSPQCLRGANLIEVMVVIAILGVLLAIALPSFNSTTQGDRTLTEIQDLATDIRFARSEAIKEGADVELCIAADSTLSSCTTNTGASAWQYGWVVWSTAQSQVLRAHPALSSSDSLGITSGAAISGTSPASDAIHFTSDGLVPNAAGGLFFSATPTTPANVLATHCLSVGITGQLQVLSHGNSVTINNTSGTSSTVAQTC